MKDIRAPTIAQTMVRFIAQYPWLSLVFGLVISGVLAPGIPKIYADFSYRGFFYPDDPMLVDFDRFERQFGNDDAIVVAIHSPSGIFDAESGELIREITEAMWKIPEVIRVDSIANYNWVHADEDELIVEPLLPDAGPLTPELLEDRKSVALKHEVIPRYLVSDDAQTALVFATLKPGIDAPPNVSIIIPAVRTLVEDYSRGDHRLYISGGPAVTFGFKEAAELDAGFLYPLSFVLTLVFLGVLLRSLIGVVLALLVVIPSILATLGLMGHLGIELTNTTFIVPQILLAIGVADAIHILTTFFRTAATGVDRQTSARYSLLKNFMPTLITSITTSFGFLSFTTSSLKPVVGLGILGCFGTMLAWLTTYLILGALLFILPIKRAIRPSHATARTEERASRIAAWLIHNNRAIVFGVSIVCIFAFSLSFMNTINSDPFKYFREGYPIRAANEFIEDSVGGARGCELSIASGAEDGIKDPKFLTKVETLQSWLEDMPDVTRAISIVDILKMTNRSLHGDKSEFLRLPADRQTIAQELLLYQMSLPPGMNINDRITIQNDAVRITVLWTIATSQEVVDRIEQIEKKAARMGLDIVVTGKNRIWQSMNGYVVRSFLTSLAAALVLISIILALFFRSLSMGVLALLPNAVPLIIGGGVLYLIGKPIDVGVALVTSVTLGIAVDDTIHVLSNFVRLRREGHSAQESICDILAHTTPALVTTSAILVSAFGIFSFGTFTPNVYFGLMVAIILTVALVTDLTFLPALLSWKERRS